MTVVVPTFNRARLLERTIPTYLQEPVEKVILVDDGSADETARVAEALAARHPGRIAYLRNDRNRKQTYSKNRGKAAAATPFVYFGDDDSVLVPGSIEALLETSEALGADVVGAAAVYCKVGQGPDDALAAYLQQTPSSSPESYVDLRRLRFSFTRRASTPVALPVTQAAVLVRRAWCERISFDERFTGNCYREETDFLLSCSRAGARIFLDGRAVQINLAPDVASGGARSGGRLRYEWYCLLNTVRFLRKHRDYYERALHTWHLAPVAHYLAARVTAAGRRMTR